MPRSLRDRKRFVDQSLELGNYWPSTVDVAGSGYPGGTDAEQVGQVVQRPELADIVANSASTGQALLEQPARLFLVVLFERKVAHRAQRKRLDAPSTHGPRLCHRGNCIIHGIARKAEPVCRSGS